ncbi:host attachment family protein [Labrenzia sp. 011]|uniref:host attachment family protein n=1 Tax=Labrenzia sp. 011 TaxID=2171494 RepID=UPI000D50E623|nr:host attachment family protein [Labrenzia sp. 011]PVB61539.1 Host attachment protein [Labrenzia sp. 011]
MSELIRLKHGGWVVVADGAKALFLRNEGDEKFPNLEIFRKEEQDNPPSRDQCTDRPGRKSDGPQGHRSAVAETDWHQLAEDNFASDLADILYKRAHKGDFSQMVLVAAPSVLGQIRKELHKEVNARILAEIGKDLTNHPVDEIEKLILGAA